MDRSTLVPFRFHLVFAAAALLAFATAGPASADSVARVVTSIKPVHSLVSAVMAGAGEPHLIMRGVSSPHDFNLRPSDAAAIEDALVIFLIDESLEASLAGPAKTLAGRARVVEHSKAKDLIRRPLREGGAFEADDHEHGDHGNDEDSRRHEDDERSGEGPAAHHDDHERDDHEDGAFDLHIWLDPVNARAMARMIAETLSEADAANAAVYQENAHALLGRLDDLTAEIAADVAPARGKQFIVFHDGYRYFEDRFGLTTTGSIVVGPEHSSGVKRIRELRDRVRELGVTCVFSEPQFEPRLIAAIIEGTRVRSGTLDPLGANIENGPELYFSLLREMAASFNDCLAPAERE